MPGTTRFSSAFELLAADLAEFVPALRRTDPADAPPARLPRRAPSLPRHGTPYDTAPRTAGRPVRRDAPYGGTPRTAGRSVRRSRPTTPPGREGGAGRAPSPALMERAHYRDTNPVRARTAAHVIAEILTDHSRARVSPPSSP
ncbi:hypothetical protein [Streptomyces sp. NPDC017520]|uniref:hypothetical protein n=1 Tax=Streptomyces sp. NPDC017520 TaxID=3364998 RepID=UPI0037B05445